MALAAAVGAVPRRLLARVVAEQLRSVTAPNVERGLLLIPVRLLGADLQLAVFEPAAGEGEQPDQLP